MGWLNKEGKIKKYFQSKKEKSQTEVRVEWSMRNSWPKLHESKNNRIKTNNSIEKPKNEKKIESNSGEEGLRRHINSVSFIRFSFVCVFSHVQSLTNQIYYTLRKNKNKQGESHFRREEERKIEAICCEGRRCERVTNKTNTTTKGRVNKCKMSLFSCFFLSLGYFFLS